MPAAAGLAMLVPLIVVVAQLFDAALVSLRAETMFDPGTVIISAIRLMKPRADAALVRIEFENPACGIRITADEIALKRVVLNLLSNAVKFSGPGSAVTLRSEVLADGRLRVTQAGFPVLDAVVADLAA